MSNGNIFEFERGDWIVHRHYGVGQIRGIEKKAISGEPIEYFRVKTERSTFWIPVETASEEDYFRPLATLEEGQEISDILTRPARDMADDFRKRQTRIRNVEKSDSPLETARLVRDLWVRRATQKLNGTERRALREMKRRLLAEWSTCMGWDESEAKRQLTRLLSRSKAKVVSAD